MPIGRWASQCAAASACAVPSSERWKPGSRPYSTRSGLKTSPCRSRCTAVVMPLILPNAFERELSDGCSSVGGHACDRSAATTSATCAPTPTASPRCSPTPTRPPGCRTCPDWTAADLLWHLGEVQSFWATIVRERLTDPDAGERSRRARTTTTRCWRFFDAQAAAAARRARRRRRRHAGVDLVPRRPHRRVRPPPAGARGADPPPRRRTGRRPGHRHRPGAGHRRRRRGVRLDVLRRCRRGRPPARPARSVGCTPPTPAASGWCRSGRGAAPARARHRATTDEAVAAAARRPASPTFTVSGTARDLDAWLWNRPPLTEIDAGPATTSTLRAASFGRACS